MSKNVTFYPPGMRLNIGGPDMISVPTERTVIVQARPEPVKIDLSR
jgi:hypothetical protein